MTCALRSLSYTNGNSHVAPDPAHRIRRPNRSRVKSDALCARDAKRASAAEADPKVFDLILKHEDVVQLAEAVINAWRQHLGHDVEEDGLVRHEPTCPCPSSVNREASQSGATVAPIVHYVGPQIFANELHEPVALAVTERSYPVDDRSPMFPLRV
jgi:hypothetical protein